jgi:transposase
MTIHNRTAPTAAERDCATVFVAIELSRSSWVVAVHTPPVDKIGLHKLAAGDVEGLLALIARQRARAEKALAQPVQVASCYEAGYDAFWLHRVLVANDVDNHVINPSSLLVDRRARRAKSDRIDAEGMLRGLMAYARGERHVFAVVRVPSFAEEDFKRLHRERQQLIKERIRHVNRIKALLAGQGIYGFQPRRVDAVARLAELRTGDGRVLAPRLDAEIRRQLERLAMAQVMIGEVEAERNALFEPTTVAEGRDKMQLLVQLRSIGPEIASVLVGEVFYRAYDNRRQLGSYVGLTSSPFNSGAVTRDQGISKAGNRRARTTMIELAWLWLRYQPDSALSQWFRERVGDAKGRLKRIMIVALARKLLVALWRYLETGLVPTGAALKV